jgi:hypothetical protein
MLCPSRFFWCGNGDSFALLGVEHGVIPENGNFTDSVFGSRVVLLVNLPEYDG